MPDFQDQITAIEIFQQPDRRIGIDLDDLDGIRIAADVDEHIDRSDTKPERTGGLSRQGDRRFAGLLPAPSCPPRSIHPPGISRRSPFAGTASSDGSCSAMEAGERPRRARCRYGQSSKFANGVHAIARHEGQIFSRAKKRVIVEQKDAILDPFDDRLDQHGT